MSRKSGTTRTTTLAFAREWARLSIDLILHGRSELNRREAAELLAAALVRDWTIRNGGAGNCAARGRAAPKM